MPTARKELIERVGKQITELLDPLGLRQRTQDVFTRVLNAETLGWLGLNRAVHREDGALEINPMIGVRNQRLEKLVAELAGRRFHPYLPPSVAVNLGYLSRERRYVPYLFYEDDQVGEKAKALADAIASDGYAFMEASYGLSVKRPILPRNNIWRLPRGSKRYWSLKARLEIPLQMPVSNGISRPITVGHLQPSRYSSAQAFLVHLEAGPIAPPRTTAKMVEIARGMLCQACYRHVLRPGLLYEYRNAYPQGGRRLDSNQGYSA